MKNIMTMRDTVGDLWNLAGQIAQSQPYQRAKAAAQNQPHPSPEQLYQYWLDELDAEESRAIRTHLAYCPDCADDMAVIIRLEDDEEREEERHAEPVKSNGEPYHALVENIALEYWEPRYAGMELTAADMRPEPFQFQEGQITIKAFWEGARGDKPAYIWIGWEVHVQPPYHLRLRFIAPETGHILYEVNLGQTERDSESFKADELHFDPTATRFGIVAFTEAPL